MTKDIIRLKALKVVTQTRLAAMQAEFAKCCSQENALRENLAQLVHDRTRAVLRDTGKDAARNAGADIRWLQWAEDRRGAINSELALVLGRKAEVLRKLKQAFGKDQVLDGILAKAKKPS